MVLLRLVLIHANLRPFALFLMTCHCLGDWSFLSTRTFAPYADSYFAYAWIPFLTRGSFFSLLNVMYSRVMLFALNSMDDSYLASSGKRMQGARDYDLNIWAKRSNVQEKDAEAGKGAENLANKTTNNSVQNREKERSFDTRRRIALALMTQAWCQS